MVAIFVVLLILGLVAIDTALQSRPGRREPSERPAAPSLPGDS
jgi:hypothetical protein